MSQSLVLTDTTDMMAVAKQMAISKFFTDAQGAEQAFVKIMAGAELGLPPFQSMTGVHIIKGKPVLGAGLIASIIKRSGKYDYRVVEHTDQVCNIDFYQGPNKIGNSTFTIEQARKAGVQNLDKYASNMLFARAISNGAKWHTPDVFGGPVYTDGELVPEPTYTAPVVEDGTAEVVHDARVTGQARQTKLQVAQAMKEDEEKFIFDRIDEYAHNIEASTDDPSYDMNEGLIGDDKKLPESEKVSLLRRSITTRTNKVTTADEAETVKKRIAGWAKLLGEETTKELLSSLVEQAKANGVGYENKKFVAPAVEAETVE